MRGKQYCSMLPWRGCVQGSGSISKYRNQLKDGQKIRKKYPKNQNGIFCCHDLAEAGCVDGSGSISKYRTKPQIWLEYQKTMRKKCK